MSTDGDRGRFRIHGSVGTDPTAYLLRDLRSEEPTWAALAGDGDVWPGVVLTGAWEDDRRRLADWTVERAESLAVVESDAALPDAVWDAWASRTAGRRRVTTVLPAERCEVHVSVPPPDADPDAILERMLAGGYSFEPWFEELVELDDGAAHLTVVAPPERSAFVFFGTPPDAPVEPVRRRRERLGLAPFPEP